MNKILEEIKKYEECFPQSNYKEYVEVFDDVEKESVSLPCSCAFNCLVLGLKETGHKGHVSIIHKRDSRSWANGRTEVYFREYALGADGRVHFIKEHGALCVYGEKDLA